MGFRRARVLGPLLALFFFVAGSGFYGSPGAQALSFGRKLFHVRSAHFDIHFPRELESVALRLVSFADGEKEKLESIYGRDSGYPIPVLLSDEFADLNGYSTSAPSDRIVIFVAASGLGGSLAGLDDTLRSVFIHELTHSMNFRSRNNLWDELAKISGDAASPAMWLMPKAIVEGCAVFSESLGGSGRMNDPAAAEMIAQATVEKRFPTFFQLSGALDSWNSGQIPYIFGGSFIAYLVEAHGFDKLEKLWETAGQGELFAGFGGTAFGTGVFRDVFRLPVREAWKAYTESRVYPEPEPLEARKIRTTPSRIAALAASGQSLFLVDAEKGSLSELDLDAGTERAIVDADGGVERIDVSADRRRILVSWREEDSRARHVPTLMTFLRETGEREKQKRAGLRSAAWSADGMIAIQDTEFRSALILPDGARLGGGEGSTESDSAGAHPDSPLADVDFDSPVATADGRIYALARRGGRTSIARIDTSTGRVDFLEAELGQVRSISAGMKSQILVSYTLPGRLARLAILSEGESGPALAAQSRDISGGVHIPVMTDSGAVYYVGRFVGGEYLCAFPPELLVSMTQVRCAWTDRAPDTVIRGGGPEVEAGSEAETGLASEAVSEAVSASEAVAPGMPASGEGEPASPTPVTPIPVPEAEGAFPLLFRTLRLPLLDTTGFGILLQGEDLAERLSWNFQASYDWRYSGFPAALNLSATTGPFALTLGLSDRFSDGGSLPGSGVRVDSGGLSAAWHRSFAPSRKRVDSGAWASIAAVTENVLPGAAYRSSWTSRFAAFGFRVEYSDWLGSRYPPFGTRGYSASLTPETEIVLEPGGRAAFSLTARLRAALPFAGVELSLSGAFSPDASVAFGPVSRRLTPGSGSRPSSVAIAYPTFEEYSTVAASSPWYAQAEASARLFSAEIQRELPIPWLGTPLYLRRLTGRLGARLAVFDEGSAVPDPGKGVVFPASVFFRTEAQLALTGSTAFIRSLRPGIELSFATDRRLAPTALRLALSLSVIQ